MTHHTGSVPDTLARPTDWLTKAPCKDDPDAMFPNNWGPEIEAAKEFCRRCSAVERCLQWALETGEEHGVWGGLSVAERRQLRMRPVRLISIDEYAGTPRPTPAPFKGRPLRDIWAECTEQDGEHLLWTGPKHVHHKAGTFTPNRLAFYLDRGRLPDGDTKRTCAVPGCVRPAHLEDRSERAGLAA